MPLLLPLLVVEAAESSLEVYPPSTRPSPPWSREAGLEAAEAAADEEEEEAPLLVLLLEVVVYPPSPSLCPWW